MAASLVLTQPGFEPVSSRLCFVVCFSLLLTQCCMVNGLLPAGVVACGLVPSDGVGRVSCEIQHCGIHTHRAHSDTSCAFTHIVRIQTVSVGPLIGPTSLYCLKAAGKAGVCCSYEHSVGVCMQGVRLCCVV